MAVAIILGLVLLASILFTFFSPWWFSPLASNWGTIDDTLVLTFWITGVVCIAIVGFMAYAIYKYHHRKGVKADYEPENKKLELWLTILTALGVTAMLAPGLYVWNDFITVPEGADEFEAVGEQWKWSFRFPGEDGEFGTVGTQYVSFDNPFGLNPDDPAGEDDVLIFSPELHLPIGGPIKALLRSKDVLHDFYVPQFRAKMDLVPGQVTYFWFTPTREGRFDLLCAELCGVGHYTMRGHVVIEDEESFREWLGKNPTFAQTIAARGEGASGGTLFEQGRRVAGESGCFGCHSIDGSPGVGPTWRGLFGKTETLVDGSQLLVDDDYLRESITDPAAAVIQGFQPIMPSYEFSDDEMSALLTFIKADAGPSGLITEEDRQMQDAMDHDMSEGEMGAADPVAAGRQLADELGCMSCHSLDGRQGLGPTWQGLMGRSETMGDGSSIVVDEDYLRESITDPGAKVVEGYDALMPPYDLSDEEMEALLAFLASQTE